MGQVFEQDDGHSSCSGNIVDCGSMRYHAKFWFAPICIHASALKIENRMSVLSADIPSRFFGFFDANTTSRHLNQLLSFNPKAISPCNNAMSAAVKREEG